MSPEATRLVASMDKEKAITLLKALSSKKYEELCRLYVEVAAVRSLLKEIED